MTSNPELKGTVMNAIQRAAQVIMVIFGLLTIVFYSSVYAATGGDAHALRTPMPSLPPEAQLSASW